MVALENWYCMCVEGQWCLSTCGIYLDPTSGMYGAVECVEKVREKH